MRNAALVFILSLLWVTTPFAQDAPAPEASASSEEVPAVDPETTVPAEEVPEGTPEEAVEASEEESSEPESAAIVPVEEILLDQGELNLHVGGDEMRLFAAVLPDEATNKTVRWSSSDRAVARVSPTGLITPIGPGFAYIVASSADGKVTASASVFVKAAGEAPSVDPKISTALEGEASLVFGTDLDTGKSAFSNPAKVSLIIDLVSGGENATTSDDADIWGEIKIKTDGDPVRLEADDVATGSSLTLDTGFKIWVDYATIHFGKNAFVTIQDYLADRHSSKYGNLVYLNYMANPDVAYAFVGADTEKRYGLLIPKVLMQESIEQDFSVRYGFVSGYSVPNLFSVEFALGSSKGWDDGTDPTKNTASLDETDWGYRVTGSFDAIDNLVTEAGFSGGIAGADSVTLPDVAFGGKVGYQFDLADEFYMMPKLGMSWMQLDGIGSFYPIVSASYRLGYGTRGDAFDFWDAKYEEDDEGSYPGISVGARYVDKTLISKPNNALYLNVSVNTGSLEEIDGLAFVAAYEVVDILAAEKQSGLTAGFAYTVKTEGKEVTPQFFVTRYMDGVDPEEDYMYFKAGLKIANLFPHVNWEFNYESNDLLTGFDNGVEYQKKGKAETLLTVTF